MQVKVNSWLVTFAIALSSCASSSADCWPNLIASHNNFYYAFDRSNYDRDEIRIARSDLLEKLAICTSDDNFLATPSEVGIGNEVTISLMDVAVIADDAVLTTKFANHQQSSEIDGLDASGLLYAGQYLHLGAFFESRKAVHELLRLGFDPNARDDSQLTPLHVAKVVTSDGLEIVRDLVSYGADIDSQSERKITPVMLARLHGDLAKAQCLISLGAAPPEISDFDGLSIDASRKRSVAAVDAFLFSPVRRMPPDISTTCSPIQPN